MMKEDLLQSLFGAALIAAGGEVPLDRVQSLFREKFDKDLPYDASQVTLQTYLTTNFSNICRVKKATDGHFVVRMLQLPHIAHLLPADYNEPEFEAVTTSAARTVSSPQGSKAVAANQLGQLSHKEVKYPAKPMIPKTPNAAYRSRYDVFTKSEYQDDPNSSLRLAELENQLAEECSVRGIAEPTFKLTACGGERREVFCVASWGEEKIQSYPGVFATENGAKASVIKQILTGMDGLVEKILSQKTSSKDAAAARNSITGNSEHTMTSLKAAVNNFESETVSSATAATTTDAAAAAAAAAASTAASIEDKQHEWNDVNGEVDDFDVLSCGGVLPDDTTENYESLEEPSGAPGGEPEMRYPTSAPVMDKFWKQLNETEGVPDKKMPSEELEPRITTELPWSEGYLSNVLEDASMVVQIKGPGLDRWERQTYAFDPRSPVQEIVPFRWYVVQIMEVEDVQFFDRAMCLSEDGPYYDERGFVQLNFPDNGYTDFIDPNAVFSLINYEEISRVPPQGLLIHAIGLSGATPVEELQVAHPPNHLLLFLPAESSNCFMSDCAPDIPHVYIYDTVLKRVLC